MVDKELIINTKNTAFLAVTFALMFSFVAIAEAQTGETEGTSYNHPDKRKYFIQRDIPCRGRT
jgi:hypothetical protein